MNKLTLLIFLVFNMLISASSIAAEKNIILPAKSASITIPTNIHYLSMGPRFRVKRLRVSIVVDEIYPSIFIEEITSRDTEGKPDIISNSYYLVGEDITGKLGDKKWSRLDTFKSIKWHKWNEFEMNHKKIKFKIIYNSNNKFNIIIINK